MTTEMNAHQGQRSATGTERRWLRRTASLAAGLVIAGSLVATGPAEAAESWQRHQLDGDACYDAATMDSNRNGYAEVIWFDLDNDCKFDTRMWNSVGSEDFMESMTFDMDEDGHWETWIADNDQRVGFDVAYFDDGQDGRYDRWMRIPAASTPVGTGSGTSTVSLGPVTNPDPVYSLVLRLAEETGTAVFSESDRDGDGWYDYEDARPGDPFRH